MRIARHGAIFLATDGRFGYHGRVFPYGFIDGDAVHHRVTWHQV